MIRLDAFTNQLKPQWATLLRLAPRLFLRGALQDPISEHFSVLTTDANAASFITQFSSEGVFLRGKIVHNINPYSWATTSNQGYLLAGTQAANSTLLLRLNH